MSQQASIYRSATPITGYKVDEESTDICVRHAPSQEIRHVETAPHGYPKRGSHDESVSHYKKVVKSFSFAYDAHQFNFTITDTSKHPPQPAYYAVCSQFGPGKPDITFHAGSDRHGSQLAVAYFGFSRHVRMGFGVEPMTGSGDWEEMRNVSCLLGHGRYEFEYNVPEAVTEYVHEIDSSAGRTRKKFIWARTRNEADGVNGTVEHHFGWRNYRLVEQASGHVLAVMLVSMFTGFSYKGELNIHGSLSTDMEQVIVLSALSILEKGERRMGRYTFGR